MRKRLILAALLSVFLAGCMVATAPYNPGMGGYHQAPPARYEYRGPPPAVGHFWVGGDWLWVGQRYAWRPGRWSAPSRPAYRHAAPPVVYDRHRHSAPEVRPSRQPQERYDPRRNDRHEGRRHGRPD